MFKNITAALVVLAFSGWSGIANAGPVIFDNGGPLDPSDAWLSDVGQRMADDFVLTSGNALLGDIHWTGYYDPDEVGGTDNFTIAIYDDVNSLPAAVASYVINVGNSATRTDIGTIESNTYGTIDHFYQYSLDIDPIALIAGTTYWLSIVNDYGTWGWWRSAETGGNVLGTLDDGASWLGTGTELSFSLTGPSSENVPVPATLALFGIGLAGLGWSRRKKA